MVKELTRTSIEDLIGTNRKLVLFNDEVNSFDYVINSLVEVCSHSTEQAVQCTMIVHHKGKYAVLHGSGDDLKPRCTALLDRGLTAEIV